ncbi:MAG: hypothetical protein C4K48_09215 [Candidatus Thorarchaeota archaeon]|nr:MAG: hypothetical protein C4K48_09215 [Candidatus Thorarchaeota archaeon]
MPLSRHPRDQIYYAAARMMTEGRNREAIEALRLLIEKNSNHVNGHVTLAVALMQRQENLDKNNPGTIEALALIDTVTSLNPNDPIPLIEKQM